MKHVTLPVDTLRPLPFYLALEEWVATVLPEDDWFFIWQAPDAVIIGRHQDLHAEVDTDFCRREGIAVYRRRSGGGAVFADSGNLMFSFVTARSESLANAFAGFTAMLAGMLRTLGIDAAPGGRNDIYIGGAKVSGCAAYSLGNRKIAHGTMLHSVDTRRMAGALTPPPAKLARHGVSSVEARVTALSRHTTLSLAELRTRAIATLTDGERHLTPAEVARVEALSQHYYDPQWTEGTPLRQLNQHHHRLTNGTTVCHPENHTAPQPAH